MESEETRVLCPALLNEAHSFYNMKTAGSQECFITGRLLYVSLTCTSEEATKNVLSHRAGWRLGVT